VSDGAFAASVCDVAVAPAFQRRRIGRQLVERLVRACLARGAASCVVFPHPRERVRVPAGALPEAGCAPWLALGHAWTVLAE